MGNQKAPLDIQDPCQLAVKTLGHPQWLLKEVIRGTSGTGTVPGRVQVLWLLLQPLPGPGTVMLCKRLCNGEAVKHTGSFCYGKNPKPDQPQTLHAPDSFYLRLASLGTRVRCLSFREAV